MSTPAEVSRRMKSNKRRDTKPELMVRRELHRRGLRYFVDKPARPGPKNRIDILFPRKKVAIEVYGCFWHNCALHGTIPSNNREMWISKFARNRERDLQVKSELEALGWRVIILWEHDNVVEAADIVEAVVAQRTLMERT